MKYRILVTLSVSALALMGGSACQRLTFSTNTSTTNHGVTLRTAAKNAFGSLTNVSTSPSTSATTVTDSTTASTATTPAQMLKIKPEGVGGVIYQFTGTPLTLSDTTINVLQRNTGSGLPMSTDLKTLAGLGTMNFSKSANPLIENMTLRRGDESWNIDPINGSISMYRVDNTVYPMMKTLVAPTVPTDGPQPINANISPTGEQLAMALSVASDFLSSHGISTNPYGEAILISSPNYITAQAVSDSISARPVPAYSQQIQVLYPLVIGGQSVVQSSGEPMGLTLTIDLTNNAVTSMYGLMTLDFTQSSYDAINDFTTIQKMAEQGGFNGYYGAPVTDGTGTVTVKLDTPERVLMSSYIYAENRSREMYVPALRFPIIQPVDGYTKWVVVPLAKDLPTNTPIGIEASAGTSGSGGASAVTK